MNPFQMMSMLQQFRQNPMQMLAQRRMNVPQEISNDPNAILNHLLQTGQISQQQINQASQMASMLRR